MFESILHGTIEIHWLALTFLCSGCTCLGFAAAAVCAAASWRDRMEYGPRISDVEPEGE